MMEVEVLFSSMIELQEKLNVERGFNFVTFATIYALLLQDVILQKTFRKVNFIVFLIFK